MKTALVHDWLISIGGAEKVLEAIYGLYPSKIHTLVQDPKLLIGTFFADKQIETSFIQSLPIAKKMHRSYLPFFPIAIEQFNLTGYDVILSSSHAVAKGVLTHANQLHICYCHTPIRYAWDLYPSYMEPLGWFKKPMAQMVLHGIRKWDISSLNRVDHFIANSYYVSKRIQKIYGKKARVIYPPVEIDSFYISATKEDYFIACSRLVPYKRMDLIVEAFRNMPDKKLLIVGAGPELSKLKKRATQNIELLGFCSNEELRQLLSQAKALIFAAEEDFGIVMVEALSSGTPVIALAKGGACEIILDEKMGILYPHQTPSCLIGAIDQFEQDRDRFDPQYIKSSAARFSRKRFEQEFQSFVTDKYTEFLDISKRMTMQ